jgi:hypothetical protein
MIMLITTLQHEACAAWRIFICSDAAISNYQIKEASGRLPRGCLKAGQRAFDSGTGVNKLIEGPITNG